MWFKKNVHIFVVGLPASGKTTLCNLLRAWSPHFAYASDLTALHDFAHQYALAQMSAPDSSVLSIVAKEPSAETTVLVVRRDANGMLEFDDPTIWDKALQRSYASAQSASYLLFEFSRGADPAYKKHFQIEDGGIYARSFQILERCTLREITRLVVHLSCPAHVARERNRARRSQGHALSSDVMGVSYSLDPLQDLTARDGGSVVVDTHSRWPLLSINSAEFSAKAASHLVAQWITKHS